MTRYRLGAGDIGSEIVISEMGKFLAQLGQRYKLLDPNKINCTLKKISIIVYQQLLDPLLAL